MNFIEAVKLAKKGYRITRQNKKDISFNYLWANPTPTDPYLNSDDYGFENSFLPELTIDDYLADDWIDYKEDKNQNEK